MLVVGTGSVTLPCGLKMSECLHVTNITKNHLPVAYLAATAGVSTSFDADEVVLHMPGGS